MKKKSVLFVLCLPFFGLFGTSCHQNPKSAVSEEKIAKTEVLLKDYGAEPTVLDIESYTDANDNFRTALWTGGKIQVTLMSIPVGGDVGLERHPDTDQFLRIEDGKAKVMMGDSEDALDFTEMAGKDFAVFVPAGKWHNLVNIGDKPLKLYSIYSPVEHPHGTVHKTQKDSEEAEHHH